MEISRRKCSKIGPLHDPVTWYEINYTGMQITQWDFQNKGKSGWTGASSFVLEVPLRNLHPSVIYSVPCDRIVQRAYLGIPNEVVLFFGIYVNSQVSTKCQLVFLAVITASWTSHARMTVTRVR